MQVLREAIWHIVMDFILCNS